MKSALFIAWVLMTTPARAQSPSNPSTSNIEVQIGVGRFVTATYKVDEDKQAAFLALLKGCETTMRAEGLISPRPALRMRSQQDTTLLLEIFEWVDAEAFNRAQQNPKVLEFWGKYEAIWIEGGFGVDRFPEAKEPWAEFVPID